MSADDEMIAGIERANATPTAEATNLVKIGVITLAAVFGLVVWFRFRR